MRRKRRKRTDPFRIFLAVTLGNRYNKEVGGISQPGILPLFFRFKILRRKKEYPR